jgi:hypothetical protein
MGELHDPVKRRPRLGGMLSYIIAQQFDSVPSSS